MQRGHRGVTTHALTTAELTERVKRTAHPCGCKSGAVMVIVALVGWPAWRLAEGPPPDIPGAVAAWGGLVVAAALVGKLGGIAVGRWNHRRLRRALDRALAAGS